MYIYALEVQHMHVKYTKLLTKHSHICSICLETILFTTSDTYLKHKDKCLEVYNFNYSKRTILRRLKAAGLHYLPQINSYLIVIRLPNLHCTGRYVAEVPAILDRSLILSHFSYKPYVRTVWSNYESKKCQPLAQTYLESLRDVSLPLGSILDPCLPCSALLGFYSLNHDITVGKLILEKQTSQPSLVKAL